MVRDLGKREGKVAPRTEDRIDINAKAEKAPRKTMSLGCRIDRIAAIRKVLSPISEAWWVRRKDWKIRYLTRWELSLDAAY